VQDRSNHLGTGRAQSLSTHESRVLAAHGFGALAEVGRRQTFARGTLVHGQSDVLNQFLIVVSGQLRAHHQTLQGRQITLGLYTTGDVVGFADALAGHRSRVFVQASQDSSCLMIRRDRVLELFSKKPALVATLLPPLLRNLVGCTNCLAVSGGVSVEARIARVFLRLLADIRISDQQQGWILVQLSRGDIADLVGSTIETCSRVMSRWRRQRIVLKTDEGFLVKELATLKKLAQL